MIVVKLIGGLGNQMFQYAAGRALALRHGTDLFLDLSALERDPAGAYTRRHFELDAFQVKAKPADPGLLAQFPQNGSRLLRKFQGLFPSLFSKLIFNESQSGFQKAFSSLPATTYLNGYWQDETYFSSIRETLLQDFQLKQESPGFKRQLGIISSVKAVSLHIRRGDYASLPQANKFHGLLSLQYYESAVKQMQAKDENVKFFIFSDDLDWCKKSLAFIPDPIFVDGKSEGLSAQEELILMSRCRHNIIANSSFSWWAAWLNTHADKTVIAPAQWFSKDQKQPDSLIPQNWIKIRV